MIHISYCNQYKIELDKCDVSPVERRSAEYLIYHTLDMTPIEHNLSVQRLIGIYGPLESNYLFAFHVFFRPASRGAMGDFSLSSGQDRVARSKPLKPGPSDQKPGKIFSKTGKTRANFKKPGNHFL